MSHSSDKKALHFGAGNIGRGFIGPLLANAGYHVVFADVDELTISRLNEQDHYGVHILDKDEDPRHKEDISNISGVISTQPETEATIADSSVRIITTAVGPTVLPKIAPMIAQGLTRRRKQSPSAGLNVIACENKVGATASLREAVLSALKDPADKQWVAAYVGFANCSVDRIVPPFDPSDEPAAESELDVGVEGFFEWVVEAPALKEPMPEVEGMQLTDDLEAYVERKLYTLNTGHATAAYLGYLKGLPTIDVAIADPQIREAVEGALEQSGAALVKKHGFKQDEHNAYIEKILSRFENPAIKDSTNRVGRQPLRKLGKDDRLVGPATMCKELGLPHDKLMVGIAAAFAYENEDDEQAKELKERIGKEGLEKVVADVTGFNDTDVQVVVKKYEELQGWKVSKTGKKH